MAAAATAARGGARPARRRGNRLRRRRGQDSEEPVRLREGLRVHPADEDRRRHRATRRSQGRRDRRAVRRRRRDRPVDQPDVHRHLQDPDRARRRAARSSSARTRPPSAASRASPKSWTRRRARPARPTGAINWMTHGDARGHAGADEAARRRGDPGDRRHGPGARGLQRRQAGLRRRPGQRARLHRADRRRAEGRPRHRHRQDLRQRRALLVRELGRRRRADRRGGQARVSGAGRLLPVDGRDGRASRECSSRRSGCRTRRSSARPRRSSPSKCGITVPADTRVLIAPLDGVGRDYPLSIEKLCPVLSFYVVQDWREGCERCKQILRYGGMGHTMSIHSQNDQVILEFGLKKPAFRIVRQHADDARVDRPDDRSRSGDDAGLRRLRRQHHVGQHLAAAPAEHQAAGVRDHPGPRTGSSAVAPAAAAASRSPVLPAAAGRLRRREPARASAPMSSSAGSTSSSGRGASGRDLPRPRGTSPRTRATGRRPGHAGRGNRRSTSCARKTFGLAIKPDARSWFPSARSSHRLPAISAKQHRVFKSRPGADMLVEC